jgi:fatty acid desaturase
MVPDVDERFGGDVDDFLGPLRQGNPLGADATKNPVLRAFVVSASILASLFTFQLMFVIQAFAELRHYGDQKAGPTHGSRAAADEDMIRGAIITLIHVCVGLACMGPVGYLSFSFGMSGTLQIFAAGFHQPSGVENHAPSNYYDRQVKSATNLKHPDNPLLDFLTFGGSGYHIEHHLWENVPVIHLPKLASTARDYCKTNGLEYREVTFTDAWNSWLQEGWRLSGIPRSAQ